MTIDEQIAALAPLDPRMVATLAGYANRRQFAVYRARGRPMRDTRLEILALNLESLAAAARKMKK